MTALGIHQDAQVAAIVWAALLPSSFVGQVPCTSGVKVTKRVLTDSLALITSARPRFSTEMLS